MRRSSYTPLPPEPLIVVEEAEGSEDEHDERTEQQQYEADEASRMDVAGAVQPSYNYSLDEEDPPDVSALLCPWRDPRDLRKRSLPTPSCTSGITASQVRRLSERSAATARESAFLATLTSAPAPGRRHSVTISRVPPTIYPGCRGRRESIAALPSGRRDSAAANFNLHLDIMDDIAEIKGARKAKIKLYKSSSKEQICELTDGDSAPVCYHSQQSGSGLRAPHNEGRRHSDSAGLASLIPPAVPPRRKASEQFSTGIVCTDNDLVKLLSLSTSSQEVNIPPPPQFKSDPSPPVPVPVHAPPSPPPPPPPIVEEKKVNSNSRSSSLDTAAVVATTQLKKAACWFSKMSGGSNDEVEEIALETIHSESAQAENTAPSVNVITQPPAGESKVLWDKPTGSIVDAHLLGSAIEVYLRRGEGSTPAVSPGSSTAPTVPPPSPIPAGAVTATTVAATATTTAPTTASSATSQQNNDEPAKSTTASICSTFKDLFVK
ncbi:hypothetical protein B566_EDAN007635 [Ephemera danica]|nr:hypothetical protein B566_EDAN007635 [Ephemera danica]